MAGEKGNEYYKLRLKNGRDKKYTPNAFRKVALDYFEYCINNPLYEMVIQKRRVDRDTEIIEKVLLEKIRPFTIKGLCIHAQICMQTFYNYKDDNNFLDVITRVEEIIENQQFEGAAAGFFNANIIARKLGLADKQELDHGLKKSTIDSIKITRTSK